jgi:hypothetical protein
MKHFLEHTAKKLYQKLETNIPEIKICPVLIVGIYKSLIDASRIWKSGTRPEKALRLGLNA